MAALVIVVALIAAACSGGSSDSAGGSVATVDAFTDEAGPAAEAPVEAGDDGGAARSVGSELSTTPQAVLAVQTFGRDIIFTADMTVAVTDVAAAGDEATRIVESLGGFLFGQQSAGLPEPHSILIFKVSPESFRDTVSRLGGIGEVRTQNITADDVTDRIVDLESRISTAAASVERLRALIAEATSVTAIVELEGQLLERETQLETLRGQLRTIRDQVDLATVVVTLTEALSRPRVDAAVTAYPGHADAGQSCPGDGGVSVEQGEPVTVCYEIVNTGDTALADIEISDPVLGIELTDLTVVFGDLEATLEPGQFVILAAEVTPERTLRTQTRVTAAPVDGDGNALDSRRVSTTATVLLEAVDPGGLPGFSEGLDSSVDVLQTLGGVVVLVAGAVIPFAWLLLVLGVAIRWRRGRERGGRTGGPGDAPAAT